MAPVIEKRRGSSPGQPPRGVLVMEAARPPLKIFSIFYKLLLAYHSGHSGKTTVIHGEKFSRSKLFTVLDILVVVTSSNSVPKYQQVAALSYKYIQSLHFL